MTSTVDTFAPALKTIYAKVLKEPLYAPSTFFEMIKKVTNFGGEDMVIPLRYSPEPGGSATFARALANRGPSNYTRFRLTRARDYVTASITTELLRAAANKNNAETHVIPALESIMRGMRNTSARSLSNAIYGNGGGARAQVLSGVGTSTITLKNPKDIVWFEVGMQLDGSSTDGTSGSVTVGGASSVITAINRDLGQLTNNGAANWNAAAGINSLAADWYLFRGGDFGAVLTGAGGWIPDTVTSSPFFGVNRSVDGERLAGSRITPSTTGYTYSTVEGACLAILERLFLAGGKPDHIFLHPQRFRRLLEELGAKRVYSQEAKVKSPAGVSFPGVVVHGQGGECVVLSDPCCPRDTGFAVTLDTWCLYTLGEPMSIFDDNNKQIMLTEGSDDALQLRMVTYGNFACDAPAYNGRFSLAGID